MWWKMVFFVLFCDWVGKFAELVVLVNKKVFVPKLDVSAVGLENFSVMMALNQVIPDREDIEVMDLDGVEGKKSKIVLGMIDHVEYGLDGYPFEILCFFGVEENWMTKSGMFALSLLSHIKTIPVPRPFEKMDKFYLARLIKSFMLREVSDKLKDLKQRQGGGYAVLKSLYRLLQNHCQDIERIECSESTYSLDVTLTGFNLFNGLLPDVEDLFE
eukprot:TRINITY_DN2130_c0_g1_i4.p1 TRINITY_DN2130_c0_g1~~TRINITY_DN2130_c0_g1_i4.p1  ORF type:complete len:215 (-),score=47.05 TRINITY_DN2130_c0_g1_i4:14-658(-)